MQTAVNYATLAVVPIQRYASQYGPNSVDVSPNVTPFPANLNGNSFTETEFEGWVDEVAKMARDNQVNNPALWFYTIDHSQPLQCSRVSGTPSIRLLLLERRSAIAWCLGKIYPSPTTITRSTIGQPKRSTPTISATRLLRWSSIQCLAWATQRFAMHAPAIATTANLICLTKTATL